MSLNSLILAGKVYGDSWTVKSTNPMPKEVADQIKEVTCVAGDYGLQLCFHLKRGGQIYKKPSQDANFVEGQVIDPQELTVITLTKSGEEDIVRFK